MRLRHCRTLLLEREDTSVRNRWYVDDSFLNAISVLVREKRG